MTSLTFIGGHSIGATLALCIQDVPELEKELPRTSHGWLADAADYIDHGTDQDQLDSSVYQLPPKTISAAAIDGISCASDPINGPSSAC
jgi:hypothetical protein